MEQIKEEKPHKKPVTMVIQETSQKDLINLDSKDDEELGIINAIRFQQGKPPFRCGGSGFKPAANKRHPFKCRFCKKMGHMQNECKSKIWNGGPEVDANGEPYASFANKAGDPPSGGSRVHVIQELVGHVSSYAAAAVQAVEEMRWEHLNHLNCS